MTATELYSNSTLTDDPVGLLLGGPLDYTDRSNMFDAFAPAAAQPHVLSQVCSSTHAFSAARLLCPCTPRRHLDISPALPPQRLLATPVPHFLCTTTTSEPYLRLCNFTQTYAFGTGVAAMGVTLTAAGLTPKNLLDPRRPLVHPSKMRQQDREEGLIPYASTLGGVNHLAVLTHRHTIARPAHVLTAPTTLESTSLVVGLGLDSMVKRARWFAPLLCWAHTFGPWVALVRHGLSIPPIPSSQK